MVGVGVGQVGFASRVVGQLGLVCGGWLSHLRLAEQVKRYFTRRVGAFWGFGQSLGFGIGAGGSTSCFKRTAQARDSTHRWFRWLCFSTMAAG